MERCVLWVEKQPKVEIDGTGVSITYWSGEDAFTRRCTRAFFRRYLEANLRKLNAFEEAERARRKVVRLERRPAHG